VLKKYDDLSQLEYFGLSRSDLPQWYIKNNMKILKVSDRYFSIIGSDLSKIVFVIAYLKE